jgi:hypothetical protein
LSSGDVDVLSSGYVNFDDELSKRENKDLWGATRNSASLARSLWQMPIAGFVPLASLVTGL